MKSKKITLSVVSSLFIWGAVLAQVPEKYYFYKGDSLNGFNITNCYQKLIHDGGSEGERLFAMKVKQQAFIRSKYNLNPVAPKPARTFQTPPLLTSSCNNLGFETGTFSGWTGSTGYNSNSTIPLVVTSPGISTLGVNSPEPSCSYHTLVTAAAGNDPYSGLPMLDPGGGNYAVRIGGENINMYAPAYTTTDPCSSGYWDGVSAYPQAAGEILEQTFPVSAANAMFTYNYAVVLDDAPHTAVEVPYFRVEVLDQSNTIIPCLQYYVQSDSTGPPAGFTVAPMLDLRGNSVYYSPWVTSSLNLTAYIGQNVTVRFTAAGCTHGGHFGYAYVDCSCGPVQVVVSSPEVCAGQSVTLTAPATGVSGSYSWTQIPSGTGIVGPNTNQNVTVNQSGTYQVTVTTAPGCTYTIDTTVAFYPLPVVTTTSTNITCNGANNGSIAATVTGGNLPYTYSWSPAPGTGQGTANAGSLSPNTYSLTVTTTNGCTATTTVPITQPAPLAFTNVITNVSCNGGSNGSATINVTGGTGTYTYSWSPNTGNTNTASGLTAGSYTLHINDANNCTLLAPVTITQPTALTQTNTHVDVACNGGNTGSISVTASGGTGAYTYSWSPAPGAGQGTANPTGLTAQTYTLTLTDANGCTITTPVTISQPTLLTVNVSSTNPPCNGICNGSLICIPNGGTTTYTYSWSTGCTAPSCNNICPGTYSLTVTDAHGCTASGTTTITQPSALVLNTCSVPAHCGQANGLDSVVASGATPSYTYSWSPGPGSSSSIYSGLTPGNYTVTVTDAHNCVATSTMTVGNLASLTASIGPPVNVSCFGGSNGSATASAGSGTLPYTYSWTPSGGNAATANNLSAGTYTCTVMDSAHCVVSATVTISQPPGLTLTPIAPVTICIGQSTPLNATATGGTPAYTYSWTLNGNPVTSPVSPVVTTTYTVTVTEAHGCNAGPLTVVVTVNPPLEVTTANAANICNGGSVGLSATGSGGNGSYSYTWIPATGLSSTTIANPTAQPSVNTTYTVIVSDGCGTPTDSALVTVNLWPNPIVTFSAPDTVGCAPLCVTFAETSNPPCASAAWTFGDGGLGSGCAPVTHCYTNPGQYTVNLSVTDIHGCVGTAVKNNYINVYPVPVAAFTASPQPTTIVNPTITFTDGSTGANTWNWTFGDVANASSNLQNPTYTYQDTGCYRVILVVQNSYGCKDTARSNVCIDPEFAFYAPNTFTPNGDGKNDFWMPYGVGIDESTYDVMMFDRWGNLIWESHQWGQGWDGRANGGSQIAQIDTYVWKVKLNDFRGNRHAYTGHCNLIK